jgi:hypothetical protein
MAELWIWGIDGEIAEAYENIELHQIKNKMKNRQEKELSNDEKLELCLKSLYRKYKRLGDRELIGLGDNPSMDTLRTVYSDQSFELLINEIIMYAPYKLFEKYK